MQEQRMFSAEPHRELLLIDSESTNRISVLLLDSDPNHAEGLTRTLQSLGYVVTTCSDIHSVLHGLSNSDFDVLIVSSNRPSEWRTYITQIHKITRTKRYPSRVICLARVYRGPQERLDAERLGVRFIYER
jgi:DNA-binding NarL/FixJ family response regulator